MVPGEGGRIVKSKQPHLALVCAPIVYDVKSIAPTKQSNLCSMHCNVSFRIELIVQNISVYVLILMVSYDVPRREGLRKRKIMISRALQKSKYLFSWHCCNIALTVIASTGLTNNTITGANVQLKQISQQILVNSKKSQFLTARYALHFVFPCDCDKYKNDRRNSGGTLRQN